jgi:outer membrane biosynthesis protein TonB
MPGFQLLADFDGVVAILFAVISIGAAIVNAIGGKKEPPRRNPGRPKNNTVRKEIEEFLEQQGGRKPQRREEVVVEDVDVVEVVEEPRPRPKPKPQVPKPKKQQSPKPVAQKPAPKPAATPRPVIAPTQVSRRGDAPLGSNDLGTGLKDHVAAAMGERIAAQAQRDLPHLQSHVDQKVREDLGTFSVSGKEAAPSSKTSPLIQMLRNPQSARHAVIIAEVMGRPKALRK